MIGVEACTRVDGKLAEDDLSGNARQIKQYSADGGGRVDLDGPGRASLIFLSVWQCHAVLSQSQASR